MMLIETVGVILWLFVLILPVLQQQPIRGGRRFAADMINSLIIFLAETRLLVNTEHDK